MQVAFSVAVCVAIRHRLYSHAIPIAKTMALLMAILMHIPMATLLAMIMAIFMVRPMQLFAPMVPPMAILLCG